MRKPASLVLPVLLAGLAAARAAAPPVAPAADVADLLPRVNTSAAPPAPAAPAAAAAPGPASAPLAPAAPVARPAAAAEDRLELGATQVTGNRELPRVMYVVPWKRAEPRQGRGRPSNSLLEEVLTPVDRDVALRQGRYYEALRPDAAPRE